MSRPPIMTTAASTMPTSADPVDACRVQVRRRLLMAAVAASTVAGFAPAVAAAEATALPASDLPRLDRQQSQRFREWMLLLIHAQLEQGPSPRWGHRDCAGLVRFAVGESLREHDLSWKKANGLLGRRLPADLEPAPRSALRNRWRRADGSVAAYVGALELVQANARLVSRQLGQAEGADLLLFDFGDEQHLMVWMGRYLAYHTGHVEPGDNGLRALRPAQLLAWQDTRWRPAADNPNFAGLYRLAFLA